MIPLTLQRSSTVVAEAVAYDALQFDVRSDITVPKAEIE